MPNLRIPALALASALLAPAAAHAGAAGLKHERSIYLDARERPLASPEGVACDEAGNVVVADTGNARLLLYTWKEGSLAGGAEVKLAQLSHPVRVQIDRRGNVLALDRRTRRIVRLDARGGFAGAVEPRGAAGTVAPTSFKLDAADRLLVLDGAAARVLVLDASDAVVREVALPREGGTFTDVAVDESGAVYALDAVQARVWILPGEGKAFRALTPPMKDRMSFPGYIAAERGKLYLVDQNGHGVVVLGQDGAFLGRELGMGWSEGSLYYPSQLCLSRGGQAFLADRSNNRVQVFTMAR